MRVHHKGPVKPTEPVFKGDVDAWRKEVEGTKPDDSYPMRGFWACFGSEFFPPRR